MFFPLRATTTAADSKRDARAVQKKGSSATLRHHNRQSDDCRTSDRKNRDVEGFRTHLKQPGVPARQGDPFHGADFKRCADEQAAEAPSGLAEKADQETSEYTDHHDQQGPLAQ